MGILDYVRDRLDALLASHEVARDDNDTHYFVFPIWGEAAARQALERVTKATGFVGAVVRGADVPGLCEAAADDFLRGVG